MPRDYGRVRSWSWHFSRQGCRPALWLREAHQLEQLGATGDVAFADDAQTRRVELQRHDALLEPAPLIAADDMPERPGRDGGLGVVLHDPGLVLGVPAPELLTVGVGRPRVRRHDRAGDRAADTRLPRSFPALHRPVRAERRSVLAEVPDVAGVVGGVPVVGRLGDGAVG